MGVQYTSLVLSSFFGKVRRFSQSLSWLKTSCAHFLRTFVLKIRMTRLNFPHMPSPTLVELVAQTSKEIADYHC